MTPSRAQTVIDGLYRDVERRIAASPPGLCPVDLAMNFLNLCHAQTCGKCVPCRVGLGQLSDLMESVLDGKATMETIALIERTARVIVTSADCDIGGAAARALPVETGEKRCDDSVVEVGNQIILFAHCRCLYLCICGEPPSGSFGCE